MKFEITEQNGVYTCTIPLQMRDGRVCLIQGRASIAEVAKDFGFSPNEFAEVGGIFGSIGKFFKKVAKSKAIRKAVKITKGVLKNPITSAALGVVTGGASVPFTASAAAALRIADAARKAGKKGLKAKRLMKATLRQAEKEEKLKTTARKELASGKYPRAKLRQVQLKEAQYKQKIATLKAALKGKKFKKLSPDQKKKVAKLLGPYVHELRFA